MELSGEVQDPAAVPPESLVWNLVDKKILLPQPGIEPPFLGRPTRGVVTIPAALS
jgi:hypothetical protein